MSCWRVIDGQEVAFREAWTDLDRAFATLARPPLSGTLLQHRSDPTLFVSFGSWTSSEDIEAMRRDASAQDAFLRVHELCEDVDTNTFLEVAHHEKRREHDRPQEVTIEVAHLEVQHLDLDLDVGHATLNTSTQEEEDAERPRIQLHEQTEKPRRRRRVTRRRGRAGQTESQ